MDVTKMPGLRRLDVAMITSLRWLDVAMVPGTAPHLSPPGYQPATPGLTLRRGIFSLYSPPRLAYPYGGSCPAREEALTGGMPKVKEMYAVPGFGGLTACITDVWRTSPELDAMGSAEQNDIGMPACLLSWIRRRGSWFLGGVAVAAPRNDIIDEINKIMLQEVPGQVKYYKSFDDVTDIEDSVHYTQEFLILLNPSGLPPYELKLTSGIPLMLLANLNPPNM
ncbi:hypothetical protein PR048_016410 [Dryococelus australis]|uniref:ATP-dependent DNA helicase n=1 Tax=Dryococelus australis TaxID=614101 RepID=A0ABQ9HJN8_9NEOP|nr:hypothetical protein PR048_016410 [Dryococelus australis]